MQIIARDTPVDMAQMLNLFDCPAILVTADYRILAANQHYLDSFGNIQADEAALCYRVSHGYNVPCDQAGEQCPLSMAARSLNRERVLHIHQTPRGPEHVDVELLPLVDDAGRLKFFVELLKPVRQASPQVDRSDMVGNSPAFNDLLGMITRVGASEASVMLLGESGTGKELAAQAIHQASPRKDKSLVTLECAGLTESLFESELFGYVRGAFTGASHNREGLAGMANGGTLFLDEIGDVPLPLQVKLLRLLETGTYRPVGSSEIRRTDFRLVCATNKDIPALVARGEFRQDLWFRINVFPVHMPSLAERRGDIPLLANTILKRLSKKRNYTLTDSAMSLLRQHEYKGNIRELRNILARAQVLANTNVIDPRVIRQCFAIDRQPDSGATDAGDAGYGARDTLPVAAGFPGSLTQSEGTYLRGLLQYCGGDKEAAAGIAGISLRSLYRKLQQHGLNRSA